MKIVNARRISQVFFFALFVWFCVVATVGEELWQLRGWPVNWFLNLDPLVAVGTILTTHSLYAPLLWALLTVVLTILIGRFFCSWVCPFGSIHHFTGWLAHRKKPIRKRVELNRYRKAQGVKYFVLVFFLAMAAFPSAAATLQTGLLDPIPLVTRSFNLFLLPIVDRSTNLTTATNRNYEFSWLIFTVFAVFVLLNFVIPRFFCRFICPLGALFGVLDRLAIWRIGKNKQDYPKCRFCEQSCEGGCEPTRDIKISECVLCFNCVDDCFHGLVTYQRQKSAAGEITQPNISRRGFALSLAGGIFAVGAVRLGAKSSENWYHKTIRPPGALSEEQFLKRCIKCGQCMRVCPTNVIQPAGIEGGIEGLWTPVLNNRIGTSGCQLNCVACSQVCPTAALRPITLAEKRGLKEFADQGPIKLGTAFVDRTRCLPWAMGVPCIVCEENCPLSPKAIFTKEFFETVRDGLLQVENASPEQVTIAGKILEPGRYETGDYYLQTADGQRNPIIKNTKNTLHIATESPLEPVPAANDRIELKVRLQKPYIDIEKCIGCGICEHECPVSGKRAVRVSADGETRSRQRQLKLGG